MEQFPSVEEFHALLTKEDELSNLLEALRQLDRVEEPQQVVEATEKAEGYWT